MAPRSSLSVSSAASTLVFVLAGCAPLDAAEPDPSPDPTDTPDGNDSSADAGATTPGAGTNDPAAEEGDASSALDPRDGAPRDAGTRDAEPLDVAREPSTREPDAGGGADVREPDADSGSSVPAGGKPDVSSANGGSGSGGRGSSCRGASGSTIAGSGVLQEQTFSVVSTARFRIASAFHAALTVDPSRSGPLELRVRADDNVLPFVHVDESDGAVVVHLADGAYCLTELSVTATVGSLEELTAVEASVVTLRDLAGPYVSLAAEGASRLDASGQAARWQMRLETASQGALSVATAEQVALSLADASQLSLSGAAVETQLAADAASALIATAPSFATQRAQVELQGISSARLCVREQVTGVVADLSTLHVACDGAIDVSGRALRE